MSKTRVIIREKNICIEDKFKNQKGYIDDYILIHNEFIKAIVVTKNGIGVFKLEELEVVTHETTN